MGVYYKYNINQKIMKLKNYRTLSIKQSVVEAVL